MKSFKLILVSWALLTFISWNAHAAKDPVVIHYVDRPPYAVTLVDGKPRGVVADVAAKIFKKAKIPFVWEKTPINRQFMIVKANVGKHCVLGMEKTDSRAEFATFTEPLYISQPLIAIMHPRINEKKNITMAEMLDKYSILVKENYTLGDAITAMVMKSPKKQLVSSESIQMVQMIAHGRADFMMISNDEVEYYIQKGILDPKSIRLRKIADVDKSFTRRLMCNKSMAPKIFDKLNAVIATLDVQPAKMVYLNTLH